MSIYQFIVENELSRLCKWLRIMGFDAVWADNSSFAQIIERCISEDRIFITSNRSAVMNKGISKFSCLVFSEYIEVQLMELSRKFYVWDHVHLFCRCIQCNELLQKVQRSAVKDKIPEFTYNNESDFAVCKTCSKIYWKGTHKTYAEKKMRHYKAICLEDLRVRKLQAMVDNVIFEIMDPNNSREDCLNKVVELQQKAMELFPGQIETFKIIYLPKLQRIIDSRTVDRLD